MIKSTDKGTTFSSPVNIGIGYEPVVAVSADDSKVYCAWYRKEPAENTWTVQCSASSDGGANFLPSVQVSDSDATASERIDPHFGLDLAASSDGSKVYCAFPRRYEGSWLWRVVFSRSLDYGAQFDTGQIISTEVHNGYYPQLATAGNDVYIIWQHDSYEHNHIWMRQ